MAAATIWAWDEDNGVWVKVKVNADGVLEVSMAVTNLDDLADVYVPSPTDGYYLYWDDASAKWRCKALDAQTAAEVAALIATHAALPNVHHAEAHTLASHSTKAHSELTGVGTSDHHVRYADSEAVSAMGAKANSNPLNHDRYANSEAVAAIKADANFPLITLTFIIDGGGSAITTGQKGHLEIPFACTLTAWTLAADVAGAIVIDVWKDTYANFPPTDADAMPGAGKEPTIAATNQKAQDTDISDWTTKAIAAGDILAFNVDSCTTITRVTLSLKATKT
jgi:hypothetical protein